MSWDGRLIHHVIEIPERCDLSADARIQTGKDNIGITIKKHTKEIH
jgi:hypothetical protein